MDRRIAAGWAALFRLDANEEIVQSLTRKCRLRELGHREMLIEQGDDDKSVFLIVEGTAKVVRWTENGDDTWLSNLNEGDLVGEIAPLIDTARTSSVIANGRLLAAQINGTDFLALLKSFPDLSLALNRLLALRLKQTSDQLVAQVREDAAQRLHTYLTTISEPLPDRPGSRILREPPTVSLMGQRIHTTRETASRMLTKLKEMNLVEESPNSGFIVYSARRDDTDQIS